MSAENENTEAQRRLTSWKEIAAYVGRDERTAKRWENARGLPVRRVPGSNHGSVFAYAEEIEAWLHGRAIAGGVKPPSSSATAPERSGQWPKRTMTGAFLLFAAVSLTALVLFGRNATAPVTAPRTHDALAASLYLSGLHAWQTRTPSGLNRAIAQFTQAIARDPRFAEAWVGLADACNLAGEFTVTPRDQDYLRAAAAARHAITLDPSLAGAHAALAFSEFYGSRDPSAAEKEFRRAVMLDPKSADAHHWYATFLMTTGRFDAALSEIAKAESLDAESTAIPADKALILFHLGRSTEAIRLLTQLEEDNPVFSSPHSYLAVIALAEDNDAAYLRELKMAARARHDNTGIALSDKAAQGLAEGGHAGMLGALFAAQNKLFAANRITAFALAETCARLRNEACTKSNLETSVARHEVDNIGLGIDASFERFHKTDWFPRLLAKAGLPTRV